MFRFKSAERLRALFTSKPLFRRNVLLRSRSPASMYSSRGGDVVRLTCESSAKGGICNVYLIPALPMVNPLKDDPLKRKQHGQQIQALINSHKPEVVFLGLCPTLAHDLRPRHMLRRIVGRLFDGEVLAEFRAANEEARKLGGKVILGNRPDRITWHRSTNCPPSLLLASPFFLFPNRLANLMEFGLYIDPDCFPEPLADVQSDTKKIYVDESSRYMSATLLKVAREHSSVVAVVRSYHFPGIRKYWKQPIEVEDLLTDTWPAGALFSKFVTYCLFGCVIYIIIYSL